MHVETTFRLEHLLRNLPLGTFSLEPSVWNLALVQNAAAFVFLDIAQLAYFRCSTNYGGLGRQSLTRWAPPVAAGTHGSASDGVRQFAHAPR